MIVLNQIRKNLIKEIKTSGIAQRTIAQKLNITPQTLNNYLKKETLPALDTFANLCVILDLDANEVLGITEERKRQN
ncbi:MAG: helix-turn-helix transcriptional regulator [Clostridia bacterium]|nr:helix-turn-helix transcriptional regulator [Clostridia bacterium]